MRYFIHNKTGNIYILLHIAEECSSSDGEQETSGMVEVKNADVLELPTSASPEVVVSSEEKQKKSERKKAKK